MREMRCRGVARLVNIDQVLKAVAMVRTEVGCLKVFVKRKDGAPLPGIRGQKTGGPGHWFPSRCSAAAPTSYQR